MYQAVRCPSALCRGGSTDPIGGGLGTEKASPAALTVSRSHLAGMGAATVGKHAGDTDDHRHDQKDETGNQNHETLRTNVVCLRCTHS